MLLNKKTVRKNKALKNNQKADRKLNRDKTLERGSELKRNIGKVVALSSEEIIGGESKIGQSPIIPKDASELVSMIEKAGLTGMSGSGFPTAEKIKTFLAASKNNKAILINGAECEPSLLNDAWLMRHKGKELNEAAALLKSLLPANRIVLAVRGKNECLPDVKNSAAEIVRVPLAYPMGEEHLLISKALGIKLDNAAIPANEGVLVLNVQTVYQLWRIVNDCYDGGKFVTLANLKTGEARIAYAKNGEEIKLFLIKAFGGSNGVFCAGGGMMRAEKISESEKFTSTVSFACIAEAADCNSESPCKKCGGCTKKCPMGVSVKDIVLAREKDPNADISAWNADKCIHCGTCAYFCAAGKNTMRCFEQK